MKKETISSLFERIQSIIVEKLMSPEVLEIPRGRTFFCDGFNTDDNCWDSDVAQLVVPLNDEVAEILSTDEYFTAHPSEYHNVWYVYADKEITLPRNGWEQYIILSLKTDNKQNYKLCIRLMCYGNDNDNVASHEQVVTSGSITQIAQTVGSNKFPGEASAVFKTCLETVAPKIEEFERHDKEVRLFADTNVVDYDSVMAFVDSLTDKNVLKSKGHGIELFTYGRVIALINKSSKSVNVLVNRDRKAQFCRLEDFSDDLLRMIRCENRD